MRERRLRLRPRVTLSFLFCSFYLFQLDSDRTGGIYSCSRRCGNVCKRPEGRSCGKRCLRAVGKRAAFPAGREYLFSIGRAAVFHISIVDHSQMDFIKLSISSKSLSVISVLSFTEIILIPIRRSFFVYSIADHKSRPKRSRADTTKIS